ncbi:3-hydroxylacyl-ACP dehydratase [Acinetobacter halotolerans]|uniref:3-hydroxylacyl-ACP dehydratase n=1 Tax=Acinetobacter halotolerans TaxID=1752076 RepID=A0A4Q6X901_9GAMM|nr:3-hydroxylacyl-ACP dehydratase [Acinetobacter halotolerans]RZF50780.1 3-hydroxylacyl-ACP dehydratase [Acinetobacter halotolerans]
MKLDAIHYIPHEQPMVFIDHLIEANEGYAIAELTIRPGLMFCEAQGLPTWVSIEIMAQTVSAYSGWMGQQLQQSPKVGFLLGTRKLQLPIPYFELGQTLKIRVEQQYLHEGLGQFSCEIYDAEHVISAMLSVYEPTDQSTLIL